MRYLVITCLASILCMGQAYAQAFKPGFIITPEGKKLTGVVKRTSFTNSSLSCSFKSVIGKDTSKTQVYTPDVLQGYGYNDEATYETKIVSFWDIIAQEETTDTLFVESIIKGKASLYYFKDNRPTSRLETWQTPHHFYVQKDGGKLHELKITGRNVYRDGLKKVRTTKLYLGILNSLFSDCPTTKSMINKERVTLQRSSLIKFVTTYNHCLDSSQEIISKSSSGIGQFGFSAHLLMSNVKFSGSPETRLDKAAYTGIGWGMYYLFSLDRHNQALGQIELNFGGYKYAISHKDAARTSTWDISYVQLPFILRYASSDPKAQFFMGAGLSLDLSLGMKETLSETYLINSTTATAGTSKENFRSASTGYIVEVGLLAKMGKSSRLQLGLRYNRNSGFMGGGEAKLNITSVRLGIGF